MPDRHQHGHFHPLNPGRGIKSVFHLAESGPGIAGLIVRRINSKNRSSRATGRRDTKESAAQCG